MNFTEALDVYVEELDEKQVSAFRELISQHELTEQDVNQPFNYGLLFKKKNISKFGVFNFFWAAYHDVPYWKQVLGVYLLLNLILPAWLAGTLGLAITVSCVLYGGNLQVLTHIRKAAMGESLTAKARKIFMGSVAASYLALTGVMHWMSDGYEAESIKVAEAPGCSGVSVGEIIDELDGGVKWYRGESNATQVLACVKGDYEMPNGNTAILDTCFTGRTTRYQGEERISISATGSLNGNRLLWKNAYTALCAKAR